MLGDLASRLICAQIVSPAEMCVLPGDAETLKPGHCDACKVTGPKGRILCGVDARLRRVFGACGLRWGARLSIDRYQQGHWQQSLLTRDKVLSFVQLSNAKDSSCNGTAHHCAESRASLPC